MRGKRLAGALALALILGAFAPLHAGYTKTLRLKVRVVDTQGLPVPLAMVTIRGQHAAEVRPTDTAGWAKIKIRILKHEIPVMTVRRAEYTAVVDREVLSDDRGQLLVVLLGGRK